MSSINNNFKNSEFYKQYQSVLKWNNDFGVKMYKTPVKNITQEMIDYRYKIIAEEVRELNEGLEKKDLIEIWDAVSDILVTLYGALGSFGYELNLDIDIYNSEFADTFNKPSIHLLEKPETLSKITECVKILNNQLIMLKYYCSKKNIKKSSEVIHFMVRTTLTCSYYSFLNPNKGLEIVQKSNYTKSCNTEKEALQSIEDYKTGKKKKLVENPGYKKLGNLYILYDKDTNKILKGNSFIDADFKKAIEFSD